MNDNEEPAKTVAILALQSSLLCASEEKWQRIAELLASRLHHPVAVLNLQRDEPGAIDLQSTVEWYANLGYRRFVIMPLGLGEFDLQLLIPVVAWMRSHGLSLRFHVARSWKVPDWAEAIMPAIADTLTKLTASQATDGNRSRLAVLLVEQGESLSDSNDNSDGQEIASLAYHCQQVDEQIDVRYCFIDRKYPRLQKAISKLDSDGIHTILLLAWRMDWSEISCMFREVRALHAIEFAEPDSGCAWSWDRFTDDSPASIEILEHPAWMHVALGLYLDALSNRSLERYFANDLDDQKSVAIEYGLKALDQRIDSMLPSEYQGRTEEISPKSMGSATIPSNEFGKVPWDEIWTSFCDLAMAGGPPHRGRLLEAVTADEARSDLAAYDQVAGEIIRGIEMVTGLRSVRSENLGWVGVHCDNEQMAAWLMRAIIVENVMVRREGAIIFLPAGPKFSVKREIKNVITCVAKTVHYWRAHLRISS